MLIKFFFLKSAKNRPAESEKQKIYLVWPYMGSAWAATHMIPFSVSVVFVMHKIHTTCVGHMINISGVLNVSECYSLAQRPTRAVTVSTSSSVQDCHRVSWKVLDIPEYFDLILVA